MGGKRILIAGEQTRPKQGTLLGWLSIFGLTIALSFTTFIFILTYAGFEAGEMGTMIGVFGAISFIFLLPWLAIKVIITIGIFKGKQWAVVISLIFTIIGFIPGFFTLGAGLPIFLISIAFLSLMLWSEIRCLKHPYYKM